MSDMLEKVALGICAVSSTHGVPCIPPACELCTREARAAILAMREPTEAMVSAGEITGTESEIGDDRITDYDLADVWKAMIDHILAEQP